MAQNRRFRILKFCRSKSVNSTEFEKRLSEVFERRGSDAARRRFCDVGGMIRIILLKSKKGGWIGVLEKNTRTILGVEVLEKVSVRDV
jgi:hypothetical protein